MLEVLSLAFPEAGFVVVFVFEGHGEVHGVDEGVGEFAAAVLVLEVGEDFLEEGVVLSRWNIEVEMSFVAGHTMLVGHEAAGLVGDGVGLQPGDGLLASSLVRGGPFVVREAEEDDVPLLLASDFVDMANELGHVVSCEL